jgi:hypothetical protein
MQYEHTQPGIFMIAGMACALAVILFVPLPMPLFLLVLCVMAAGLTLFYQLSVEITAKEVRCAFGIGLISRSIPLAEIHQARSVKNPWFAGWGIRWLPGHYWLWNVSGFLAVELTMRDGKRFRIGTDEPEKLAAAIEAARAMAQ